MTRCLPWLLALMMPCAASCPGEGPDDDDSSAVADDDDDASPADGPLVGGVLIQEIVSDGSGGEPWAFVWPWGIYDQPFPGNELGVVWGPYGLMPTMVEGDCTYMGGLVPGFCDPPCEFDEYCSAEDTCEPWPVYRDAGVMTVAGLKEALTITPGASGFYMVDWECCPEDLFDGGDTVTLSAEGNETPAFEVSAVAVDALEPALDCDMALSGEEDLTITWTPAGPASVVRWEMVAAPHAGQGPMVLCETADTGSLTVPAAIVGQYLLDRGPYETLRLSRYRRELVQVDHGNVVSLEIASIRRCDHTF